MKIKSSDREIRELLIAWALVSLAFAFALGRIQNFPRYFLLSAVTIGPAFLFHELAHKIVAQRYGCWAEFRMSLNMLFFAVFLAMVLRVVVAAPGAVMISGYGLTKDQNGKISVSGVVTNLLLVLLFLPLSFVPGFIGLIGSWGALINSIIAAFNMIPFGMFDGRKVLAWNKVIYLFVTALAVCAVILTNLISSVYGGTI